jgi:UDP-3-O-[3-hydroxymyristoyl] glucosamine N-acyltransferase
MTGGSTYTLREIAERLGGELIGDGNVRVRAVGTLERAGAETLSFLANERYQRQLATTRAAAVIVGPVARNATSLPRIVCANPHACYARAARLFNPARRARAGVHPQAVVHPEARIGTGVEIGACAVIGARARVGEGTIVAAGVHIGEDVEIGRESHLHAGVTVCDHCVLGDRVEIHPGAVIGADGFGLAFDEGCWIKIPQTGRVVIGNDVEIGANTTIDRGAIEDTVIEEGVKLDNQIQIGHNVRIGAHTAIAACTGIAGSTHIGRHCRIAGGVGIIGHLRIADHVEITAGTGISKSIEDPGVYSGAYPFGTNREWRRNAAQLRHLAELARRVAALEKEINNRGSGGSS